MLYPFEKADLQILVESYEFGEVSKEGICIKNDKRINIPTFEILFNTATSIIANAGYDFSRVYPHDANSFLRVFRHEGMIHDGKLYWAFGYSLHFTKKIFFTSYDFTLPFADKCLIYRWINNKNVTFHPYFVDYYLNIKR